MKNKKNQCLVLCLTICVIIGITMGCGKREVNKYPEKGKEDITDTSKKEETGTKEENDEFSYKDLKDYAFSFSSGAGAWSTELQIHEDGSFEGSYSDMDMGVSGTDYPNGTQYICEFSGQFTNPEKVNDVTYSAHIKSIKFVKEPGTEKIEDGIKYIYSEPYGLAGAKQLLFYLPDATIADLPEGYQSWINMAIKPGQTKLNFYGLYNEAEENGFTSYAKSSNEADTEPQLTAIEEELKEVSQKEEELNDKLNKKDITQVEINNISAQIYKLWDDELNKIWGKLKNSLDENKMKQLTEAERAWIKEKEDKVRKVGEEVKGGSMQTCMENNEAAELTKKRVYELADMLQ